jgi:hypothetical protein
VRSFSTVIARSRGHRQHASSTGRSGAGSQDYWRFWRRNRAGDLCGLPQLIVICRNIGLFTWPLPAIDGCKVKGVNVCDKNSTQGRMRTRLEKLNETIFRDLTALDAVDRQESMGSHPAVSGCERKLAAEGRSKPRSMLPPTDGVQFQIGKGQ